MLVENLEDRKARAVREMKKLRETVTLVDGKPNGFIGRLRTNLSIDPTDVLESKMNNYDAHSAAQRAKRGTKATALYDEEERLVEARKDHQETVNTCGMMRGQAKVRSTRLISRAPEIN